LVDYLKGPFALGITVAVIRLFDIGPFAPTLCPMLKALNIVVLDHSILYAFQVGASSLVS